MYAIGGLNMVVYKVYELCRGIVCQCTDSDDVIAFINRNEYEVYSVYCGGPGIVVFEVKK